MAIHGLQNGPKTVIFPNALFFTLPLGFTGVFGRRSQTPNKVFFTRGPIPKVLTSETPCIGQIQIGVRGWNVFSHV